MKRGNVLRRSSAIRRKGPLPRGRGLRVKEAPQRHKNRNAGRAAEEAIARTYFEVTGDPLILQPGSGNRWHKPGDGISTKHLV